MWALLVTFALCGAHPGVELAAEKGVPGDAAQDLSHNPTAEIGDFSSVGTASPWIGRSGSESQYQFNFDESSWIFAREKCLAQNADLVSINDQAELDFILSRYPIDVRLRDRYLLIGLAKDPVTGWDAWLDKSPVSQQLVPWRHGEPVDGGWASCAYFSVNGRILSRVNCDVRTLPILLTRYICERTPEDEKYTIAADKLDSPVDIFLFLRQLGKLAELEINNQTEVQLFGKIDEKINLELEVRDKALE